MPDRLNIPPGTIYGRLVVVGDAPSQFTPNGRKKHRRLLVRCTGERCDPQPFSVRLDALRKGVSTSCGCAQREAVSKAATKHGEWDGPLYRTWAGCNGRCHNPNNVGYPDYGGRGIEVCPEWRYPKHGGTSTTPFQNFRAYVLVAMGPKPAPGTIDRIDNDQGYEPGNIRWASQTEQKQSRLDGRPGMRRNVMLTHPDGRCTTLTEWAEELGISPWTLAARRRYGWSDTRILTTPVQHRRVRRGGILV